MNLDRVLPKDKTLSALKSLWQYNFAFDVGPYFKKHSGGRKFALAGEAGLIMCTWPKGGRPSGRPYGVDLYSECMHGFEYQAAGHMIFEGLVKEGLAVTRSVHDRYHPSKRNPWNEIECGEHYARSMASYGVFLAACGFEHHGPKGHIGFAPRLTPENFKAAFIGAVPPEEIVKGYPYQPDQYVELSQSELDQLQPGDDKTNHLEHFLKPSFVDPVLFAGRSLYLAPANLAAARPFIMVRQAMEKSRLTSRHHSTAKIRICRVRFASTGQTVDFPPTSPHSRIVSPGTVSKAGPFYPLSRATRSGSGDHIGVLPGCDSRAGATDVHLVSVASRRKRSSH